MRKRCKIINTRGNMGNDDPSHFHTRCRRENSAGFDGAKLLRSATPTRRDHCRTVLRLPTPTGAGRSNGVLDFALRATRALGDIFDIGRYWGRVRVLRPTARVLFVSFLMRHVPECCRKLCRRYISFLLQSSRCQVNVQSFRCQVNDLSNELRDRSGMQFEMLFTDGLDTVGEERFVSHRQEF